MKSALFIDDDEDYLYIIGRLKDSGSLPNLTEIFTATNGSKALNFLIENLNQKLPEALFVDINMPVMDGHEFLKEFAVLRSKHQQLKDVEPVAVVTSSTSKNDKTKVEELGFVKQYLVKDVEIKELANKINELLK